jgi:hypothetical protein
MQKKANMSKHVQFKNPLEEKSNVQLSKNVQLDPWSVWWNTIPTGTKIAFAIMIVAFLTVWIAGLVKMGHCGGRKSWIWWVTIFVPIFVPFVGPLWGFVVGIVALAMLHNGGKMLTMHCSK